MKKRLISIFLFLLAGACNAAPKSFTARITLYNGNDRFGKITKSGEKPKHEATAAVDPNKIPFFSKIKIKELEGILGNGIYTALDTGKDVKTRKAAIWMAEKLRNAGEIDETKYEEYSKAPVIDIFVDVGDRELRKLANKLPHFVSVLIEPAA